MGYRSEVVVALTKEKTKQFLTQTNIGVATNFITALSGRYEKDKWYLFHFCDVKWYEDYAEVKAVMDFINNLNDEANEEFEYHCMGEDYEDYTVMGHMNSPFEINMSRSLDFYT